MIYWPCYAHLAKVNSPFVSRARFHEIYTVSFDFWFVDEERKMIKLNAPFLIIFKYIIPCVINSLYTRFHILRMHRVSADELNSNSSLREQCLALNNLWQFPSRLTVSRKPINSSMIIPINRIIIRCIRIQRSSGEELVTAYVVRINQSFANDILVAVEITCTPFYVYTLFLQVAWRNGIRR